MVELSLPTPEICGLNPNIGKFYLPIVNLNRKDKNIEKEAGNGQSVIKMNATFFVAIASLSSPSFELRMIGLKRIGSRYNIESLVQVLKLW